MKIQHIKILLIKQLETQRRADGMYVKEWGCQSWN